MFDIKPDSISETLLLDAVRNRTPCILDEESRTRIASTTSRRLREGSFYTLCADILKSDGRLSDSLLRDLSHEEPAVQEIVHSLRASATALPSGEEAQRQLKIGNTEPFRNFFDSERTRFEREITGWRSVQTDGASAVRAVFLRALLIDAARNGEKLLHISGAHVTGPLMLDHLSLPLCVCFSSCRFDSTFSATNASCDSLTLTGSVVKGFNATCIEIDGDACLSNGFRCNGTLNLCRSEITGELDINGATVIANPGEQAIVCQNAVISGDILIAEDTQVIGETNLIMLDCRSRLICTRSTFANPDRYALSLDGAHISGSVLLDRGFRAYGQTRFLRTQIDGSATLTGGYFINSRPSSVPQKYNLYVIEEKDNSIACERALTLEAATIKGTLFMGSNANSSEAGKLVGSLNLQGATIGDLSDDPKFWPEEFIPNPPHKQLRCLIELDGFTYARFAGTAPTDKKTRKTWLQRQSTYHLDYSFRPQPWEQLIKVYRETGHGRDARDIDLNKEKSRNRARIKVAKMVVRPTLANKHLKPRWNEKLGAAFMWPVLKLEHSATTILTNYGYALKRYPILLVLAFVGGGFLYDFAANEGAFVPTSPLIYGGKLGSEPANTDLDTKLASCKKSWTSCTSPLLPREYPRFHPFLYSADLLVPVASFGQANAWAPATLTEKGSFSWSLLALRLLIWAQSLMGWALTFLLIGVFSGLLKRKT